MNYLTAVHTDIGIRKSTNQDSALVIEAETDIGNVLLTVICDGMGGLAKGEVAVLLLFRSSVSGSKSSFRLFCHSMIPPTEFSAHGKKFLLLVMRKLRNTASGRASAWE